MYWLSYQKGSFWLKEQFDCRNAAAGRIARLAEDTSFVKIFEGAKEADDYPLKNALELDEAAGRLVFESRPSVAALRDPRIAVAMAPTI